MPTYATTATIKGTRTAYTVKGTSDRGAQCPHGVWLRVPCYCDYSFHPKGDSGNICLDGCVVA